MKLKNNETAIVRACLDLLALRGIMAWRNNTTGVYDPSRMKFRTFTGRKGVSDILGILPISGRLLAVECKMPGKKMTPDQCQFIDDVRRFGGLALCVHGVDELDKALRMEGI